MLWQSLYGENDTAQAAHHYQYPLPVLLNLQLRKRGSTTKFPSQEQGMQEDKLPYQEHLLLLVVF